MSSRLNNSNICNIFTPLVFRVNTLDAFYIIWRIIVGQNSFAFLNNDTQTVVTLVVAVDW